MIQPALSHDALLADIAAANVAETNDVVGAGDISGAGDAFRMWWLGQSGFLIQWRGRHLLFDPYLSDSLTKKYAGTDKPHVRMTELTIDPRRLDFLNVVTSSHNHTDHLDADTLRPLLAVNPKLSVVVPEANREFAAERLGVDAARLVGLDAGQAVELSGFTLHGVPAAHDELEQDAAGHHRFLGYVARFGPFAVYHSGDTRLYAGMVERLRQWPIDVALLPINGAAAERRVAGNLDGREAARLAHDIGARVAVPCHYDMFEFNTATPDEFAEEAARLGQSVCILRCGERWTSRD